MTNADKTYLNLLEDIMNNGVEKDTRAGRVKSVFGRQLRFDLKEGFPILTTKKVFTKGVLHELLWFLQRPYNSHGSMNIEYLIRNGVHIWDDDAYRWFKNKIANEIKPKQLLVCVDDNDDEISHNLTKRKTNFEYWIEGESKLKDENWLKNITKDEFIDLTLQRVEICGPYMSRYRFGDLGPVYGAQWRHFGGTSLDQIHQIINTLKTNPNDRRMLCVAFNPGQLEEMALPPCHVMFQFYTRELTRKERMKIFNDRYMKGQIPKKWHDWFAEYSREYIDNDADVLMPDDGSDYDLAEIPKYGLSCMWTQRSVDSFLGLPFNISSYAMLTHIIAKITNMIPDELVGSLGDCHIYEPHFDAVREQLSRNGSDIVPKLTIKGNQKMIEDFKYEDFEIMDYHPDPVIKAPLLVG
jgi:thymidylate synthase